MVERHANTIGHALLGRNGRYVGANHLIIGVGPGQCPVGETQRRQRTANPLRTGKALRLAILVGKHADGVTLMQANDVPAPIEPVYFGLG